MDKLLGIGVVAMVAACAIVGVRLLALSMKTRKSPEMLLGTAFVLLGAIGYPLAILARGGSGGAPSARLLTLALTAQDLACLCIYAMTWRTFHPSSRRIGGLCATVGVGFAASLVGAANSGTVDGGGWYYFGFSLRAGSFAWAAWESHRYYDLLRRRLRLGLGDIVVADRFRLWTLSTLGIFLGFAIFFVGRFTTENVGAEPWVLAATSLVSLMSAGSMWLAFVPPASYLQWISTRAADRPTAPL